MRTQEHEATGTRTLQGQVGATGTYYGPGWSVTNTGTGAYLLRFTPAFRALLSLVVLCDNAGGIVICTAHAPDSATVNTYSSALAATNIAWEFIARGLAR